MRRLSRRDFLKLGTLLTGAFAVSRLRPEVRQPRQGPAMPNVLVLVFDAMSATNLSLYGYRRRTTPNLERFARHATIYNQHYSAGNFTTPGTASLLTGLYPWTHRAINEAGLVARERIDQNLFRAVGSRYHRLAYSQNIFAHFFIGQFQRDIETILSPAAFGLVHEMVAEEFGADRVDSHRAFDTLLLQDRQPPAALVLGLVDRIRLFSAVQKAKALPGPERVALAQTTNYPIYFRLPDVFDGIMSTIEGLQAPSLAYLHLWPPHAPFTPSPPFAGSFADGWQPPPKPLRRFSDSPLQDTQDGLDAHRQLYDEYIADLDAEFGRLLDMLEAKGILETSYVIVTSDHGELFERGVEGHVSRLLYEPLVHVPLLISSPGQVDRQDVHIPTSSVDLLPTLAVASGVEAPPWTEGKVLPGFGGTDEPERSIFMMEAKHNRPLQPLTNASFAIRKGRYKLIYDIGFRKRERKGAPAVEMYDIENDPEELNDLYSKSLPLAQELRTELLSKIKTADSRFAGPG